MKGIINKIKYWFKISALIDFQKWNIFILGWLLFVYYYYISNEFWLLYSLLLIFITFTLVKKYNNYWKRMYYFAICVEHKIEPKTLNLTFTNHETK